MNINSTFFRFIHFDEKKSFLNNSMHLNGVVLTKYQKKNGQIYLFN